MERIIFIGKSMEEPMLAICIPDNEEAQNCGNGNILAFAPGPSVTKCIIKQQPWAGLVMENQGNVFLMSFMVLIFVI
jgi:hypothetical protein